MDRCCAFIACCFVFLLSSCADRAIQVRLEAADSLMWRAPDSAYHILQAVAPDSLSTDGQRAYYGLLLTQAQYRTYLPLTSDSLILRSVFYYEGRDDYKYGLSLYYLGAVYQEKEFCNLAIEQYKRALEHLDQHQYPLIVALLHRQIGSVYLTQYFSQEAISHYLQAEKLYAALGDQTRLSFLYEDMGRAYRMSEKYDSAMRYYTQSLDLARQLGDSIQVGSSLNGIAWLLEAESEWSKAQQQLQNSMAANSRKIPTSNECLLLGRIAFKEGKMDSALYYLNQKPTDGLTEDKLRSEIYYVQGRYREAHDVFQQYFQKVSDTWEQRDRVRVDEIAAQYDYQKINSEKERLARNQTIGFFVGVALLFLIVALVILYITRHRKHQVEARNLNEAVRGLRQTISEDHLKLRTLIEKRMEQFATLSEWASIHRENDTALAKKVRAMIEKNPIDGQDAQEILHSVNQTSGGLIDCLRQTYSELNQSELLICALTYMGYNSNQLYAILSANNVKAIYDKRHKIVRKMQERGDLKNILDRIVLELPESKTMF